MKKQCVLASLIVFVVIFILEFVIHGVILKDIYSATASVWRPEAEIKNLMWLMWVGYLAFAPVFTWIYKKGHDRAKSGLGQGIRYGLAVGVLMSVMPSLGWYAVLPIPGKLAFFWFLAGMVEMVAAGAVLGLIYKPSE